MFASIKSLRGLQDMSSRHLQDMSSRRLQDMSSRRLQDVFKTNKCLLGTFSGVLLNFKFGTVYRLAHMWLQICSSLTKLHWRFLKKWLPWKFSFKKFMGSMKVVKETTLTVEKEPLVLVLPYRGLISQQSNQEIVKMKFRNFLVIVKLEMIFKDQTRLCDTFQLN